MKIKIATLIVITIISVTILSQVKEHVPTRVKSSNLNRFSDNSKAKIKYDFNIKFPRSKPGVVNIYKLNNKEINIVDVRIYGGLFGYKSDCVETKHSFNYEDDNTTLTINKETGLITYTSGEVTEGKKITEEEAKEKSEMFIKDKFKSLFYAQAEVELDSISNEYRVKFINTLESKKNYSYPTSVLLDIYGNIKKIDYYKNSYVKEASAKIITMQNAAQLLLTEASDITKDTFIDIKKAELIYILDKDLIVPAYLFKGELSDGAVFEQIIPATEKII